MRKYFLLLVSVALLSGCAFTTTMTMDSQGHVTGTAVFGVPKSALPKVTSIDQWTQVLSDNNFPSPNPSVSTSADPSASPTPSASCSPGEDSIRGLWTFSCDVSGDVTALSSATETSNTGNLNFTREGQKLTVTLNPSDTSTGGTGIGLKGISLVTLTNTISLPGTVTNVSAGVSQVDSNTVSFVTDENQNDALTATYQLTDAPTNEIGLTVSPSPGFNKFSNSNYVNIAVALATPVAGQIEVFDGTQSIGTQSVANDSTGVNITQENPSSGQHVYRAVFTPTDWWNFVQSTQTSTVTFTALKMLSKPLVKGQAKVGATLSVTPGTWSPSAVSISYRWLRSGKFIPGATKRTYKVGALDRGKTLTVQVTVTKVGLLGNVVTTSGIRVAK